jgi:hypothetical protein
MMSIKTSLRWRQVLMLSSAAVAGVALGGWPRAARGAVLTALQFILQ